MNIFLSGVSSQFQQTDARTDSNLRKVTGLMRVVLALARFLGCPCNAHISILARF